MINKLIFKVPEIRKGFLLSVALATMIWYFMQESNNFIIIFNNYWNYISLSATLLGFSITAFTIFFAFPLNYKLELLTKNENYPLLYDAFLLAIYLLIILLFISLVGVFVDITITNLIYLIYIFILVWSIVSVGLTVWILKRFIDVSLSGRDA